MAKNPMKNTDEVADILQAEIDKIRINHLKTRKDDGIKSNIPLDVVTTFTKGLLGSILPERFFSNSEIELGENSRTSLRTALHDLTRISESLNTSIDLKFFHKELIEATHKIYQDIDAAYLGDPAAKSHKEVVITFPGTFAISIYRIANILYRINVPIVPRAMAEWAHSKTGIDIHPGATIGAPFFIDHGTGVVIGETAVIKNNVKLYQGVTLGAVSFQRDSDGNPVKGVKRHPTVEENVVIYSNTTILGAETVIGANSTIGGNLFITSSIPQNSMVYLDLNSGLPTYKVIEKS